MIIDSCHPVLQGHWRKAPTNYKLVNAINHRTPQATLKHSVYIYGVVLRSSELYLIKYIVKDW